METSLFGTNLESGSNLRYFDQSDLQTLGQSVALALLDFHKIISDRNKFNETLVEMGKALLHEIMLNKLSSNRSKSQARPESPVQPVNGEDFANQLSSISDFASAFNEFGDLLEEADDVESSSASDVGELDFGSDYDKRILNLTRQPVSKPRIRRRRRKHRKFRRRRKNRRRNLGITNAISNGLDKADSQTNEKLKGSVGRGQKSTSMASLAPERKIHSRSRERQSGQRESSVRPVLKLPLREPTLFKPELPPENQTKIKSIEPIKNTDFIRLKMRRFIVHE